MAELEPASKRLKTCPESPNCVSSQSTNSSNSIPPIQYDVSDHDAMQRLNDVIRKMPRSTIVEFKPNYLRAEIRSALFRFVDDVEFLIDDTPGVMHVRSASRVGYWDLGANRRRVERIRTQLEKSLHSAH
jgi:uncharacterized protein (DUF1499 family)